MTRLFSRAQYTWLTSIGRDMFTQIANNLSPHDKIVVRETVRDCIDLLADALEDDNPNFNKDLFLQNVFAAGKKEAEAQAKANLYGVLPKLNAEIASYRSQYAENHMTDEFVTALIDAAKRLQDEGLTNKEILDRMDRTGEPI